ncbi:MAG: hypothetical protein V4489_08635 [Chlamydiota bacterium]
MQEISIVRKSLAILVDDYYANDKTSLLTFHFEPAAFPSSLSRLQSCSIKHACIDDKDFYVLDQFFPEEEGEEIRDLFEKASYSRFSYGSLESIDNGEKPGRSMNNQERWSLFSRYPPAIGEVYKLFSTLADQMNADLTTLPWELCHGKASAPSVITNYHEEITQESMLNGKHQDCNPQGMISFGIPILYGKEGEYHDKQFKNGDIGKPWMVSLMLYSTSKEFLPSEYQMGTVFYHDDGKEALKANCANTRMVLFEGDIFHSTDVSKIPPEKKVWRTSYVFKLVMNPKNKEQNLKEEFKSLLQKESQKVERVSVGSEARV